MRRPILPALLLLALLVALVPGSVAALTDPNERLADPRLEAEARALSKELRCLVCQNQSIDDSDAELARDLRRIVREQLAAGHSPDEVRRYLVERYGDFVLLAPPLRAATILLWGGPFVLLALAGGLLVLRARRRRPPPGGTAGGALSDAERQELDRLLAEEGRT